MSVEQSAVQSVHSPHNAIRSSDTAQILNVALNSMRDFTYIFDREGRFVYSNRPLLDLLGIELSQIVGKNFFDLNYPPDLAARLQNQIQRVFETHQVIQDETPFTSTSGQAGFYEYIFTPVFGKNGVIELVAGTTRDITQRKNAEIEREMLMRQLEVESSRFAYLFTHAPAFVTTLSGPQHIFELANPAYLQLVGYRDLIGKSVVEALPEVAGQGFVSLLDEVYASGEAYIGRENSVLLQLGPNGPLEERFVDFVYQPIFDADRAVQGIFVHGFDITAQVRARREAEEAKVSAEEARRGAEEANRIKDEFLATLSHELRTPLTAIRGWTSILQSGHASQEETAQGLSIIERNARSQGQLIEDILDVSRFITGKMRLELQPVILSGIVGDAVSTVLPAAQAKDIELKCALIDESSLVSGDPARLRQVIWNLLSNAVKFTPRGGQVTIQLRRVDSQLELTITDNGQGISDKILPHVFERFRQADSSSTRAHGGLGLGLALARHLVEMHGGTVEAHSDGLGKGSTFIVKLPAIIARDFEALSEQESTLKKTERPNLSFLHILVVDDQEDTRVLLRTVLESFGARVNCVHSAPAAFAALQDDRPDLLLSDIGMPDEDGFSLVAKVRALSPEDGGQTPAIALTAFASEEDRVRVLAADFQSHVSKPVDPLELVTLISQMIGRNSAEPA